MLGKKERVWNGNPNLERYLLPIDNLKPNPKNERLHGEANQLLLHQSFEEFGQQEALLLKADGVTMLVGNERLAQAQALGWTHVAAYPFNFEEETKAGRYGVMSNRSGELGEWHMPALTETMKWLENEGEDITTLGFPKHEIDLLKSANWEPDDPQPLPEGEEDTHSPPIKLTRSQREVFERAVAVLLDKLEKEEGGRTEISEGRALELIVADWLSGQ